MPVRQNRVTRHNSGGGYQASDSSRTSKYNLTPEQFRAQGMVTPDHIRGLHSANPPLVGQRLRLADYLAKDARVVGDLTVLRDIMSGLDFADVDLSSAYVGVAIGSLSNFLPNDPRFSFNENTRFNDEKTALGSKSTHDVAQELRAKRAGGHGQAAG